MGVGRDITVTCLLPQKSNLKQWNDGKVSSWALEDSFEVYTRPNRIYASNKQVAHPSLAWVASSRSGKATVVPEPRTHLFCFSELLHSISVCEEK